MKQDCKQCGAAGFTDTCAVCDWAVGKRVSAEWTKPLEDGQQLKFKCMQCKGEGKVNFFQTGWGYPMREWCLKCHGKGYTLETWRHPDALPKSKSLREQLEAKEAAQDASS